MASIPLAAANEICARTLAAGKDMGLKPLAAAVVDDGGHVVAFQRADGASFFRYELAFGKAYAAAGLGFPTTSGLQGFLESRPLFNDYLNENSNRKFLADAGGVKIFDDRGVCIGAVGVTGDVSIKDEEAGVRGILAAGLKTA